MSTKRPETEPISEKNEESSSNKVGSVYEVNNHEANKNTIFLPPLKRNRVVKIRFKNSPDQNASVAEFELVQASALNDPNGGMLMSDQDESTGVCDERQLKMQQ